MSSIQQEIDEQLEIKMASTLKLTERVYRREKTALATGLANIVLPLIENLDLDEVWANTEKTLRSNPQIFGIKILAEGHPEWKTFGEMDKPNSIPVTAAIKNDFGSVEIHMSISTADLLVKQMAEEKSFAMLLDRIRNAGEESLTKFTEKTKEIQKALSGDVRFLVLIAAILAGTIVMGVMLISLRRVVSRPLGLAVDHLTSLANGDLKIEVFGGRQSAEIIAISDAMQMFKDSAIEKNRLTAARAEEEKIKQLRTEKIDARMREFEEAVAASLQSVSAAASQLKDSADFMSTTAERTGQQSNAVAAAAQETSVKVQTVASATEELSSSILEIGRQVGRCNDIASNAVTEAERVNQQVEGLAEASQKIGDVVALIDDISSQTNLLALNATIEAARAGEAGKGFAVVASEVKELATQTGKATEEIGGQISDIQAATNDAVLAIGKIGKTISEISEIAAAIAAAVEEQGASTQEIASNTEQVAAGTQEVSSTIGGVHEGVTETTKSSNQVLNAAEELGRQSGTLSSEIARFLDDIKAA